MPRRRSGGSSSEGAYRRSADVYDIVYAEKRYDHEAAVIRSLVRRGAPRDYRSLLDVACGTGRHLEQFARWFECAGVDADPTMLSVARARVPSARLFEGRMESFDLHRRFDVVTCLFSAIGYVRSVGDLRRTVRNLARHTEDGGAVVVEPWLAPGVFRSGLVHHLAAKGRGVTVLRMNGTHRRGPRSEMDFHYLVGREGRVEHFVETHDLGLFDVRTMKAAFRGAGLTVRYVVGGLSTGRGLYVGRKPSRTERPPSERTRRSRGRPGPAT